MERITPQEKLDFLIHLDREFRNHHLHRQQDELYRLCPWTIDAVRNIFHQDPEKKQQFYKYTRKKGISSILCVRLSIMAKELQYAPI